VGRVERNFAESAAACSLRSPRKERRSGQHHLQPSLGWPIVVVCVELEWQPRPRPGLPHGLQGRRAVLASKSEIHACSVYICIKCSSLSFMRLSTFLNPTSLRPIGARVYTPNYHAPVVCACTHSRVLILSPPRVSKTTITFVLSLPSLLPVCSPSPQKNRWTSCGRK